MGTRLRSKGVKAIFFIIGIFMLGFSLMCASNLARYGDHIFEKSYMDTEGFKQTISRSFWDVYTLNTEYKNYSQKTADEKINLNEFKRRQQQRDWNLKNSEEQITSKYRYDIEEADKNGNKDRLTRLIENKNKEIEAAKKEIFISDEQIKKELIDEMDANYKRAKERVEEIKEIEYYIKNKKDGEIYTNLGTNINIQEYVKNGALYDVKFPSKSMEGIEYRSLNENAILFNLEAYFIVSKALDEYSPLRSQINSYSSIREKLIDNLQIGSCTLILGLIIIIFTLKGSKDENGLFSGWIFKLYEKIPIELRALVLFGAVIAAGAVMIAISKSNLLYCSYGSAKCIFYWLLCTVCTWFLVLNARGILRLLGKKEEFICQFRGSLMYILIYRPIKAYKTKLVNKSLKRKIIYIIIGASSCVPAMLINFAAAKNYRFETAVFFGLYTLGFIFILTFYIIRKIKYLNKIICGTEEIVSGNLNYNIEEKGKGTLSKLAFNINNISSGLKSSLTNEMKSERLKSELITNVSHDLKTPLTSIISYVDLLKNKELSKEEMEGYIEVLDRKAQRLKVLIEDLFEASKVASGAVELALEKVDVVSLLRQAMGEYDEKIKNSSLIFRVNIPTHNVFVNLDGKKTWRVFENLISNILKYSQPSTRVYIDLFEEDTKVMIVMKNISAYEMDFNVDEIFERFKRGDKSRNTEGSGLGLAIAKSIVELQGGRLNIEIDGDLFKVLIEFNK